MGTVPCSNCRRTDQGGLRYVYLTTFEAQERVGHRLRLCGVCYEAFVPDMLSVAEVQDKTGRWLTKEEQI